MLISICSRLFDYLAHFMLNAETDSDFSFVARRVSRSATLDGDCVIVDNGYTASDATFTINLKNITESEKVGLISLAQLHSLITISAGNDIFLGVIEKINENNGLKITFLVSKQLNEV